MGNKNDAPPAPQPGRARPVEVKLAAKQKHDNIFAALSAFQGELKPMAKTGKVDFPTKKDDNKRVSFNYTPLGEIMATIYPLLAKHGLSVRHEIGEKGVEAILTHESYDAPSYFMLYNNDVPSVEKIEPGQVKAALGTRLERIAMPAQNELRSGLVKVGQAAEMKDVGAAITYARRYTLTMVLGISSEDDKDAELLEQSKDNAVQTVFDRFKMGIENAKTSADLERQVSTIKKDIKALAEGKAPALGMTKEHYETLEKLAKEKISTLDSAQA